MKTVKSPQILDIFSKKKPKKKEEDTKRKNNYRL